MGRIAATKRESIYDFGDTLGAFRNGKSRGMDFFSPYMSRTISLFRNFRVSPASSPPSVASAMLLSRGISSHLQIVVI